LVFSLLCLATGLLLHRFAFPTLEKKLYFISKRLRDYPLLVLVIEESVAYSIFPSMSRCILCACIYGRERGEGVLRYMPPCLLEGPSQQTLVPTSQKS
jgi:hypothetical protein